MYIYVIIIRAVLMSMMTKNRITILTIIILMYMYLHECNDKNSINVDDDDKYDNNNDDYHSNYQSRKEHMSPLLSETSR